MHRWSLHSCINRCQPALIHPLTTAVAARPSQAIQNCTLKSQPLGYGQCLRTSAASEQGCSTRSDGRQQCSMELDPAIENLIARLHGNNARAVVYVTGGAVQAVSWLLSVPGASNTVLECSVPYARDSLVDILGHEPEQYCASSTAVAMAVAAYKRAANLTPFGSRILGVGATCALATVPLKRGEHRAYIACHDGAKGTHVTSMTLAKGARTRVQEDGLVSMAALELLARVSGEDTSNFKLPLMTTTSQQDNSGLDQPQQVNAQVSASVTTHGADRIVHQQLQAEDPLEALLSGKVKSVEFAHGQITVDAPRRNRIYLPGSFNPLHKGHVELLHAAQAALGDNAMQKEAAFEITIGNPDKGTLPVAEIRQRVAQFVETDLPVVVTMAPLFVNKADMLPGSVFVVGYDTAVRLVMPKYYGDSETNMLLEFARLRQQRCSFLVAGRKDPVTGAFMLLKEIPMHPGLQDLFHGLSEDHFRVDLSSTELRRMAATSRASTPTSPLSSQQLLRLVDASPACLNLSWCKAVTELPASVGQLSALRDLNLSDCEALTELPDSMGRLSALHHVNLFGCNALKELYPCLLHVDPGFVLSLTFRAQSCAAEPERNK